MMDLGVSILIIIPPIPETFVIVRINIVLNFQLFASMSNIGELAARHLLWNSKVRMFLLN